MIKELWRALGPQWVHTIAYGATAWAATHIVTGSPILASWASFITMLTIRKDWDASRGRQNSRP